MAEYNYRKALENLAPYKKGKSLDELCKENGLEKIHRLMSNENPYGCSPKVKEAVIESFGNVSNYPDDYCSGVRQAIAAKYNVFEDEIIFGNGTDEIIYFMGKAFINEGDEVVTGRVSFFSYDESVLAMGGKMVYAPMKNHGFDLDGIIDAITDKTKMIVVVNPNNPTGTVIHHNEQYEFLKKIPRNILVVIDEAYAEFYTGEDFPDTYSLLKEFKNLIILKTFSKVYGLASFRIGFGIADKELVSIMTRVKNLFNVSAQAQAAATAAIEDEEFVLAVKEKNAKAVEFVCENLSRLGLNYIPTNTSFIMVEAGANTREIVKKLLTRGFMVRSGKIFHMPEYIRVSIGTLEQMAGFINALEEIIAE
ncbi:histidinol-phosphate transaminase [Tyzzerella sp. OttesenSCG-928-J15]|nr:histidinol-phosphate transaminase [Tyzzerella sp. OttesenSCG-928-J15]